MTRKVLSAVEVESRKAGPHSPACETPGGTTVPVARVHTQVWFYSEEQRHLQLTFRLQRRFS